MSICKIGLKSKVKGGRIAIDVSDHHKLIKLANTLPWESLYALISPDLKSSTAKLKWWLGRKLKVRVHLGVYILQQLYHFKDRETEEMIRDNGAYQIFCGKMIVPKWHCPDHTKIEEFRSRLSPETQCALANKMAQVAVAHGFAMPQQLDIDSTIQEANMAYPSDANLMVKLCKMAKKVADYVNNLYTCFQLDPIKVDFSGLKKLSRKYFFARRSKEKGSESKEDSKQNALLNLWVYAHEQITKMTRMLPVLQDHDWNHMPWNIKRAANVLKNQASKYLMDVMSYLLHHKMVKGKALSFHLSEVACFNKGKLDKKYQFGRNVQLGRLLGNFFIVQKNTDVRMGDRANMPKMIDMHQELFGTNTLESVAADKGYFAKKNEQKLEDMGLPSYGLQKPGKKRELSENDQKIETELINRRSGIEPLIGHIKRCGQLGRSRMKYDSTTESAGYCSVLSFNLRQMMRYLTGEVKMVA